MCAKPKPAAVAALALIVAGTLGCTTVQRSVGSQERIADAARALLSLDPEADWTAAYNVLVEIGDPAVVYLANEPRYRAAQCGADLEVLLRNSLIKALLGIGHGPKLTLRAFEISLDVFHLDPNVRGRRLGEIHYKHPCANDWTALYPARFDHAVARHVDVLRDRDALRAWIELRVARRERLTRATTLQPRSEALFGVLSRAPADRWRFAPERQALSVADVEEPKRLPGWPVPPSAALIDTPTDTYHLIRAACIQLARSRSPEVLERLIGSLGSSNPTLSYNASFALRRSFDRAIRERMRNGPAPERSDASLLVGRLQFFQTQPIY